MGVNCGQKTVYHDSFIFKNMDPEDTHTSFNLGNFYGTAKLAFSNSKEVVLAYSVLPELNG